MAVPGAVCTAAREAQLRLQVHADVQLRQDGKESAKVCLHLGRTTSGAMGYRGNRALSCYFRDVEEDQTRGRGRLVCLEKWTGWTEGAGERRDYPRLRKVV